MALYPQFSGNLSLLLDRKCRITTSRCGNIPAQKGDIVKVVRTNTSRGRLLVEIISASPDNVAAQNAIEYKFTYWVSQRSLSVVEPLETDPPIEKRKRTSPKVLAELRRTKPCIDYVTQYCINFDYDPKLITTEQFEIFISHFNNPEVTKGTINKMINDYFESLPKKERINILDDRFADMDKILYDANQSKALVKRSLNESLKKETEALASCIVPDHASAIQSNISYYLRQLDEADKLPKDYVEKPNFSRMNNSLNQIRRAICNLINKGTFYTDFRVESYGTLESLSITLITKDVWLQEFNNPKAPKINMGSYKVKWVPYSWLNRYDTVPEEGEDYSDDYDEDFSYSYFTDSLSDSVRVFENENNIVVHGDYIHPHVSSNSICLGNIYDSTIYNLEYNDNLKFVGDIERAFENIALLLKTYNSASPYVKLLDFRIAQNPSYLSLVPVVMEHRGTTVVLSLDHNKFNARASASNINMLDINKNSIVRYIDANFKTTSPARPSEHAYIKVKLYQKYHQGLNNRPRGEAKKFYIKMQDNSFVLFEPTNTNILLDTSDVAVVESTPIPVPF